MDSCIASFSCIEHSSYFQRTWYLWKREDMTGLNGWMDEKDSKVCIYIDPEERWEMEGCKDPRWMEN